MSELNLKSFQESQINKMREKNAFTATLFFIVLLILNYWIGNTIYSAFLVFYGIVMMLFFDPIYLLVPCFLVDTIQSYFMVTESLSFNLVLVVLFITGFLIHKKFDIRLDQFDLFLLIFGLYNLFSSFLSITGDYSPGVSLLLSVFAIILVRHYTHEKIESVFSLLTITATLFSIVIILQTIASIRSGNNSQVVFDDSFNANTIAGCISVLLVIVFGSLYTSKNKNKIATYILSGAGAVTILFVGSRTALIALLSAVFCLAMFSGRFDFQKKGRSRFSIIIVALILYYAIWSVMRSNVAIFDRFTFNDVGGVESITRRTDVWNVLIETIIPDNLLFGVGFGLMNVKTAVGYYLRFPKHAHNMFLAIISETGIVGTILFFAVFAFFLYQIFKNKSKFTPIVVGMIIVGFVSGIGEEIIDRRWFWLTFAFGFLAVNYSKMKKEKKPADPELLKKENDWKNRNGKKHDIS